MTPAAAETCEACRFDGAAYALEDVLGTIRSIAARWRWLLGPVPADAIGTRPAPAVWSLAEYAAHTADVVAVHGRLLHAMTTTDLPPLPGGSFPDAAPDDPPLTEPIESVLDRLAANCERYNRTLGPTPPDALDRTATTGDTTSDAHWLIRHTIHDAGHHLVDAGRIVAALGFGAPPQTGQVRGLFASCGGVPKHARPAVDVGYRGVAGDRQASRMHHGRVWQALCLWSADVVDALRAEGHPIEPGHAGENVSVGGIDWATLRPGVRLTLGDVQCEISSFAAPCTKNAAWFSGRDFHRIDHDLHPGWSRVYASVLRDGSIRVGDPVAVEPA